MIYFCWFVFNVKNSLFKTKKCFASESSWETWEFWNLKLEDALQCLCMKQEMHFIEYNLGGKYSLVMKFVQFIWYYKKNFHQSIPQKCWISNASQVHVYIWTRNLTVIDLISFIDFICNFSIPQTLSFVKLVLEG